MVKFNQDIHNDAFPDRKRRKTRSTDLTGMADSILRKLPKVGSQGFGQRPKGTGIIQEYGPGRPIPGSYIPPEQPKMPYTQGPTTGYSQPPIDDWEREQREFGPGGYDDWKGKDSPIGAPPATGPKIPQPEVPLPKAPKPPSGMEREPEMGPGMGLPPSGLPDDIGSALALNERNRRDPFNGMFTRQGGGGANQARMELMRYQK